MQLQQSIPLRFQEGVSLLDEKLEEFKASFANQVKDIETKIVEAEKKEKTIINGFELFQAKRQIKVLHSSRRALIESYYDKLEAIVQGEW